MMKKINLNTIFNVNLMIIVVFWFLPVNIRNGGGIYGPGYLGLAVFYFLKPLCLVLFGVLTYRDIKSGNWLSVYKRLSLVLAAILVTYIKWDWDANPPYWIGE